MSTQKTAEQLNHTSEELKKSAWLMERLNFDSDEKSTLCGREFHTFTTLSVKTFSLHCIHTPRLVLLVIAILLSLGQYK